MISIKQVLRSIGRKTFSETCNFENIYGLEKEFQGDDNNENNKEQKPDFGPPDEDFEVEGNLSG